MKTLWMLPQGSKQTLTHNYWFKVTKPLEVQLVKHKHSPWALPDEYFLRTFITVPGIPKISQNHLEIKLKQMPFLSFCCLFSQDILFQERISDTSLWSHQVCESVIWQRGRGLCYLCLTCSEEVTHHPLRDLGKDSHIILLWSTCPRIPILWNSNSCFLRDNLAGSNPEQMKRQYSTWHNGALQDPPHPPTQLFLLSLNFKYKHVHGWTATQEASTLTAIV